MTATVRFRVTALATLAVVTVLIVAGYALQVTQRRLLTEDLGETIGRATGELEALATAEPLPRTLTGFGEDMIAQVVGEDGTVLAATANVAGAPPLADPPPAGQRQVRRVLGPLQPGGSRVLLISRRIDGPRGTLVLHVGAELEDIDESVATLVTSLLVAVPVVAVLLAALIWWLVGRTLRPVEAIRAEVADIGGSALHRRVPVPTGDDEIARLARTMNDMLERVESGVARQQRFVADASHELRSPLTRMRAGLEVDLAHPDRADPIDTLQSTLEETVGLQQLVDDLLLLARSDAQGLGPGSNGPVDLDDIVVRLAQRLRHGAGVRVDLAGVSAAQVRGSEDQLTRAVANLTDNAVRHAATAVTLTLAEQDGAAVLTVADDGPGIPPEHHEHVFERFTRLDEARAAATGGAGLGLAISREIVHRHGGTLTIDPDHRPGTRFVITLPLPPRR